MRSSFDLPDAQPEIEELKRKQKLPIILAVAGGVIGLLILIGVIGIGAGLLVLSDKGSTPTQIAAATDTSLLPPTLASITPTFTPLTTELPSPSSLTAEPTDEPTPEATQEPIVEPTTEPTNEPTTTPTDEPTLELTQEPMQKPTQEPTSEPLLGKIAVPVFEKGMHNIYLASADNGWTPKFLFERASQPAFSKDGQGMVLRSWNHPDWAQSIIYLPDYTNLTSFRQMTRFVEGAHPKLSSNNEIIFHRRRSGQEPVIIKLGTYPGAENDEKNQEELAEGQNPEWLDGRIIFYASFSKDGLPKAGLYVMDAGSGNPELILENPKPLVTSAAPDTDQVAISLDKDGRWQIFTFSVRQGAESLTQLTKTSDADNYLPTWSPDGKYIAFASNRDKQWAIWVMNADGSNQRKLFNLPGPIDGRISDPNVDPALSFGWWEEGISWAP